MAFQYNYIEQSSPYTQTMTNESQSKTKKEMPIMQTEIRFKCQCRTDSIERKTMKP